METRENKLNFFERISEVLEFNINDHLTDEERDKVSNFTDLYCLLQDNGAFDMEIIYYRRAMEYLMENDPSLSESINIATEYGFEIDRVNSEILASLLASRIQKDLFYDMEDEIQEFLSDCPITETKDND